MYEEIINQLPDDLIMFGALSHLIIFEKRIDARIDFYNLLLSGMMDLNNYISLCLKKKINNKEKYLNFLKECYLYWKNTDLFNKFIHSFKEFACNHLKPIIIEYESDFQAFKFTNPCNVCL